MNSKIRVSDVPDCPSCYNRTCVKCGKTAQGKQRFQCTKCGKQFSNMEWHKARFTQQERYLILFLRSSGVSNAKIAKILDVETSKVVSCIKSLQKKVDPLDSDLINNDCCKFIRSANRYFAQQKFQKDDFALLKVDIITNSPHLKSIILHKKSNT